MMKTLLAVNKIIATCLKINLFLLLIFFLSKIEASAKFKIPNTVKWVYDTTVKGVTFYHTIAPCNGKNVVFLKLVNNNKTAVKASWKELFATRQSMEKIEGFKGVKQITLQKGETVEATCNNLRRAELLIQPAEVSPTHLALIENFNYIKISVSAIK